MPLLPARNTLSSPSKVQRRGQEFEAEDCYQGEVQSPPLPAPRYANVKLNLFLYFLSVPVRARVLLCLDNDRNGRLHMSVEDLLSPLGAQGTPPLHHR